MEFMYLVFTRLPDESYRRRLSRVFVVLALRKGKEKCVELDPCVLQLVRKGWYCQASESVLNWIIDHCVLQRQGKVC